MSVDTPFDWFYAIDLPIFPTELFKLAFKHKTFLFFLGSYHTMFRFLDSINHIGFNVDLYAIYLK